MDEALEDLHIATPGDTYLSDNASTHLPRRDYDLVVSNPKELSVTVGGKTKEITTSAPTVSRALADARVPVDDVDEVAPGKDALVKDDQELKVVRVENVQRHEQVEIDAPVKVVKDDSMLKGEQKVVKKGSRGKAFQQVEIGRA